MPEFPDQTELHNTGQDELQRFRKPLLYPAELRDHPFELYVTFYFCAMLKNQLLPNLLPKLVILLV
jgi:hypothetical protein